MATQIENVQMAQILLKYEAGIRNEEGKSALQQLQESTKLGASKSQHQLLDMLKNEDEPCDVDTAVALVTENNLEQTEAKLCNEQNKDQVIKTLLDKLVVSKTSQS